MSNNRKSILLPNGSQGQPQQITDIPTTLLDPTPAPAVGHPPTEQANERAVNGLPGRIPTLPFPPPGGLQQQGALRQASARECARKAEEWRHVTNYLKIEIAKLDEQLTELRNELMYAEVQAASYDQATRTLMRPQFPDAQ